MEGERERGRGREGEREREREAGSREDEGGEEFESRELEERQNLHVCHSSQHQIKSQTAGFLLVFCLHG